MARLTRRIGLEAFACALAIHAASACNALTGASDFDVIPATETDEDNGDSGATGAGGVPGATATSGGTVETGPTGSGGGGSNPSGAGPTCGDATCAATETCAACPADCGACAPVCGGASNATTTIDADEQAFHSLINAYRAQHGLGPLALCTSLSRAAQGHSEDMRDKDYFSHIGLDGSEPWDRACDACFEQGCGPSTAIGENIAAGQPDAQEVFEGWKNSPGHNENMLTEVYTKHGIGRAIGGGEYGIYWTNLFAGDGEPSCD